MTDFIYPDYVYVYSLDIRGLHLTHYNLMYTCNTIHKILCQSRMLQQYDSPTSESSPLQTQFALRGGVEIVVCACWWHHNYCVSALLVLHRCQMLSHFYKNLFSFYKSIYSSVYLTPALPATKSIRLLRHIEIHLRQRTENQYYIPKGVGCNDILQEDTWSSNSKKEASSVVTHVATEGVG